MPLTFDTVSLEYALSDWILNEYPYSVINGEQIAKKLFELYKDKFYGSFRIARIRSDEPRNEVYHNHINALIGAGIISRIPDFNSPQSATYPFEGSYVIKSKSDYSAAEAACAIYPYSYISHLSAMDWHGFTDKNPIVVYLSVPPKSTWRARALADLQGFELEDLSKFQKTQFLPKYPTENRIFGVKIIPMSDSEMSGIMNARNGPLRLTTAARTLVDMTRRPDLCGGAQHALGSFLEHAKPHKRQLLNYLSQHARKIDRSRIGFLLHKVLRMDDKVVSDWLHESSMTRGSSKVLVPGVPFSEYFDPDWCISINEPTLQQYGIK